MVHPYMRMRLLRISAPATSLYLRLSAAVKGAMAARLQSVHLRFEKR